MPNIKEKLLFVEYLKNRKLTKQQYNEAVKFGIQILEDNNPEIVWHSEFSYGPTLFFKWHKTQQSDVYWDEIFDIKLRQCHILNKRN